MAEDLAIDVGIPAKTDEFHTFVSCVNNILNHGCGYGSDVTEQICDRCETSQLPIAKEVLRECRRQNTSNIRPSSQKWWQTWRSKRKSTDVPRWPSHKFTGKQKRPMSPKFTGKQKRPMSPMFNRKQKRPMSPMFNRNRDHRDRERDERGHHDRDHRTGGFKRYRETREPEYGRYRETREPEYERKSNKRRRYRSNND